MKEDEEEEEEEGGESIIAFHAFCQSVFASPLSSFVQGLVQHY